MGDGSHEGGKAVVNGGGAPSKWRRSGEGDDLPKGRSRFAMNAATSSVSDWASPNSTERCFAQIHSVGDVRGVANDVNEQRVDGPHRGGGKPKRRVASSTRRLAILSM